MSLVEYSWPDILDTSRHDLIRDFFEPALSRAIGYDRGVGYFSSGWLRVAAAGLAQFAAHGGRARWVTSPILAEADWEAIQAGDAARADFVLREALERNVHDLAESLQRDTLSALAWMIADGILTFKLALPRNKLDRGDFHDKFGIFTDTEENRISFNGSYNDSIQGLRNYESIKVFCSWLPPLDRLVKADAQRFDNLWSNLDPNVRVFEMPEAISEKIVQLRASDRPYPEPEWVRLRRSHIDEPVLPSAHPAMPSTIVLRDYQSGAVDAWSAHGCRGLWEMATGTGKTITALAAAVRLLSKQQRLILVIACPFTHLVAQWADVALQFGFRPVQVAEARKDWEPELVRQLQMWRRGRSAVITVITTNASFSGAALPNILQGFWSDALLIVDEAHNAGAPRMLAALPAEARWRLGLSATPIRQYDDLGTEGILDYFGEVVFRFGLAEAIGTCLTPYFYYPIPVEMAADEFEEFCILTRRIQKFVRGPDDPLPEAAQRLAIKRARVMNNSVSKLTWLCNNIEDYAGLHHTLFYVGDKLFGPVKELLGIDKHVKIHEFTQRQDKQERAQILRRFSAGDLQALVAMKCLDEGVDVPPTRTAYFLASSGNPREFVQRRGRVLRLWPGKPHATIYDLVSIPPYDYIELGEQSEDYSAVRAAVRREYRRVVEFSELAENHYQALDEMFGIADKLDLLDAGA